jgi:hypothetical protein
MDLLSQEQDARNSFCTSCCSFCNLLFFILKKTDWQKNMHTVTGPGRKTAGDTCTAVQQTTGSLAVQRLVFLRIVLVIMITLIVTALAQMQVSFKWQGRK